VSPRARRLMPNINWSDEVQTILCHLAVLTGVHLLNRTTVTAGWTELNDLFFAQPEMAGYKADNYKHGDFRKIREKFIQIRIAVQKDVDTGNSSGRTGERTDLYDHVKQIQDDIDEAAEVKESNSCAEALIARQQGH
jgi:hypothetical protein